MTLKDLKLQLRPNYSILRRAVRHRIFFIDHPSFDTVIHPNPFENFRHKPEVILTKSQHEAAFLYFNQLKKKASILLAEWPKPDSRSTLELSIRIVESIKNYESIRNLMFVFNQPLVFFTIKRSIITAKSALKQKIEDMAVPEMNLTLIRTIEKFDIQRGYEFSTYACTSLRRTLWKVIQKEMNLSRLEKDFTIMNGQNEDGNYSGQIEDKSVQKADINRMLLMDLESILNAGSGLLTLREKEVVKARHITSTGYDLDWAIIAANLKSSVDDVLYNYKTGIAKLKNAFDVEGE